MEWDEFAAGWDQQPGVQEYAAAAFQSLQRIAADRGFELDGTHACDFGCGTGLLTERLAGMSRAIDAVDASRRMLEVLDRKRTRHGWDHVRLGTTVPDDARYDLIVCSSALAFVDDYRATTRLLANRLEAGGLFVQWDWELDPEAPGGDDAGFARETIAATLTDAGLVDVIADRGFEIALGEDTMAPLVGVGRRPG